MNSTTTAMASAPQKRFQLLSNARRVHDLADACRSAALAFMAGTNAGWTRRDLAFWFVRDYASAVAWTAPRAHRRDTVLPTDRPLDETTIELLLLRTRERILEALVAGEMPALAREMVENGLVIGVRDDLSALGYAPVDGPQLRLVDRVTSLCAADYLTRTSDYESVVACEDCGQVSFAWDEVHCGECREHRVLGSAIVPRLESSPRRVG